MKRYFPILLSKASELVALNRLQQQVKVEITPVIEVLNEMMEDDDGNYEPKLENRLRDIWAFDGNSIFLDFSLYEDITGNIPHIQALFQNLWAQGVHATPVVELNSSAAAYLNLVQQLLTQFPCGLCIRLDNASLAQPNYNGSISNLLQQLGTNEQQTSILIDLGIAGSNNSNLLSSFAFQIINSLVNLQNWADVIVASGSFLKDLGQLTGPLTNTARAVVHRLNRYEWTIWNHLQAQPLAREIKYGDYGTKYPDYIPAAFEGTCSIKYTTTNEYVIYRGKKGSEHSQGGGQYHASAAALIATADYSGSGFSWGDQEIHDIANRNSRPGNAGIWVQISQNHHLTLLHSLL
jgi:hypothetical protein